MSNTAIFWPLIVQTGLIYAIYVIASGRRQRAVRAGKVRAAEFKVPMIEPEPSATAIRNLINQFELPFLFYIVCVVLYMVNGVNYPVLFLAWVFVVSRICHSYVHITSNDVRKRRPLFILGYVVNAILWLWLAWVLLRA
ncbi:MAPEG family protein [Hoeflea poritis]|uniref:MAPEG family protein n=1 Tax=Hoeflea poritis TaxID=2993659 RepID=A0ABT4VMG0_9HYPH|nr:MAPEG family protein [Hoeflea poritis]MDA4845901.1 MAPEG family protein [Hoeflea poritis]